MNADSADENLEPTDVSADDVVEASDTDARELIAEECEEPAVEEVSLGDDPEQEAGASDLLKLDRTLDLRAAEPLLKSLKARRGGDLSIDAADVDRIGALCVQVLLSAQMTWRGDGFAFSVVNASEAFFDSLETLGLSRSTFETEEAA